jgi:tetratricopeptide (TPR) repeat protein
MLATIREYGLERLRTSGEAEFIQHAYVNYYLGLAEAMTQALREGNQETWLRQLETEHDNLRDVLSWVRDNGETETSLKLVGALWRFWEMRGHFTEGRQRLEEALTTGHNASLALQAEAHTGAGTMAWYQNDYKQAIIHHETALALYQELGDQPGVAFALNNLGVQALDQGDYEQAGQFFEQSLVFSRKLGHKVTMIYALHNLGDVARRQRNYERAAALYEETLALCLELEDTWAASIQLTWLGVVRQYLGDYEQATMRLKESLILSRRLDDKERIAECLEGYAGLAVAQAGPERAARLWGAVGALRAAIGVPMALDERAEYERNVAITHDALSEAAFAAAWAAGCSMTLEQVMEYALDESLAET